MSRTQRGVAMLYVSDYADGAVMLPLAIIIAISLGVAAWWRGLAAWLAAASITFGMVLVLKAGLVALSEGYGSDYMISPSGHVASACIVYGGLFLLLLRDRLPMALIAAVPPVVALFFGYTRVALGMHSVGEAVAGAIVGCGGVAVLALTMGPRPGFKTWPVAAVSACAVLALHGLHLPAEEAIRVASSGW